MLVYFVRHGETVGNKLNFHQLPETPLTKEGIKQANRVAKRLKNKNIDLIYSSTHLRTMQTSKIISEAIGKPIEEWKELIEIRRPKEFIGKSGDDPEVKRIDEIMSKNLGKKGWKYSDEENYEEITGRAQKVLDKLVKERCENKDGNVLCVSHGTFIRTIVFKAVFGNKLTPEIFSVRNKFRMMNTGITVLQYTDKYGWELLTWNDMSHL